MLREEREQARVRLALKRWLRGRGITPATPGSVPRGSNSIATTVLRRQVTRAGGNPEEIVALELKRYEIAEELKFQEGER